MFVYERDRERDSCKSGRHYAQIIYHNINFHNITLYDDLYDKYSDWDF